MKPGAGAPNSATILRAPAKLNLWLKLTGQRRPDGRHELESHFAPLALCDVLTVRQSNTFTLSVTGPFCAGVPVDGRNLVWQAFHQFCQTFGDQPNLRIDLEKNIPHGAGLGGGSSDAGALLAYLAGTAGVPLDRVRDWSIRLGADIPAAIGPHAGHVSGIGDILGAPMPLPEAAVFLVKPHASCSTGQVFSQWRAEQACPLVSKNDLEAAACAVCPEISEILAYLRTEVNPEAQMTGSGSTCFALVHPTTSDMARHEQALAGHWTCLTEFLES